MHKTADKKLEGVVGRSSQEAKWIHSLPDPPTRYEKRAEPLRTGSLPHDPRAKSMHKTTDKKLEGFEGRSSQEAKWMHNNCSDQVIVEFPKERRIHGTVGAKEPGAIRGNPIKDILSNSAKSLDLRPRTGRENPIKEMLSRSLTKLDVFPEKHPKCQQSMQHPDCSTRKPQGGKLTHQFEDALDWSQTSIDWGGEDYY